MKTRKAAIIAFLLLVGTALLFGQTLTLVNGTQGHVLAGTIPVTADEYLRYQANPGLLKSLVLEEYSNLRDIAPESFIVDVPGFQNDTLVFGIISFPGKDGAAVFDFRVPGNATLSAQSGGVQASGTTSTTGTSSYLISEAVLSKASIGSGNLLFSSFELPSNTRPIRIDRRFVDWLSVTDIRRYSQRFTPSSVIQRTAAGMQELALEESSLWQRGGSRIERVKMLKVEDSLELMFSSFSSVSRGGRFLLRYYENAGAQAKNSFTLEVPIVGIGGPVYLWLAERAEPIIVGQYAAANFSVEARININKIPALAEAALFELSTAVAEPGIHEEFFYGQIPLAEIPDFE